VAISGDEIRGVSQSSEVLSRREEVEELKTGIRSNFVLIASMRFSKLGEQKKGLELTIETERAMKLVVISYRLRRGLAHP